MMLTRGSGTDGGAGGVGRGLLVDATAVGGCDKRGGGGGGWGSNAEAEMVCFVRYGTFVSEIWEVVRKSLGSS